MTSVIGAVFVVAIVVGLLVLLALQRPETLRVTRDATIDAPAAEVYPHLVDFRRWQPWSPWEGLDPEMERVYSGPESGVGARYSWKGNGKAGEGRMEITDTTPDRQVTLALDFVKPWESHAHVTIDLNPRGSVTHAVWTMVGPQPLMARVLGMFVSMDKMLGRDFERGLAQLNSVVRSGA